MFQPARMKRVDLVILEKDARNVTRELGRLGVLHLVEVKPEDAGADVTCVNREGDLSRLELLSARVGALAERLEIGEPPRRDSTVYMSPDLVESQLAKLEEQVDSLWKRREALALESADLQGELLRLEAFRVFRVPMRRIRESPFLHFVVGTIRESDLRRLARAVRQDAVLLPYETAEGEQKLLAITSRKGRWALETALEEHGLKRDDLASDESAAPAELIHVLEQRVARIRAEQGDIMRSLQALGREWAVRADAMRSSVDLERALIDAEQNFGHTSSTVLVSGWIPADHVRIVSDRVLETTRGRAVVQIRDPAEANVPAEEVPVLLKHHPLIRPFELIVRGFGFPMYREVEPTLIVAISFVLMFGVMFGDVGHGLVLLIAGILVNRLARRPDLRDLGVIVACCGCSAAVFGVLYGSVFGMEELIPPLLMAPMKNVMGILLAAVGLGAVVISVGVVLNIVNRLRRRDYLHGILDRFGIVGIIFYWGAIGLAIKYIVFGTGSPGRVEVALLIVPLVVLFFREPIFNLVTRRPHLTEHGVFTTLIEASVELLETLTAYIANTLSFARAGAFALGHAALCLAIFALQEAVRSLPAGVLWSALVLVTGHVIILLLEGLIVCVQVVRLEYYEFFSKFFSGEGRGYQPFQTKQ